MAKKKLANACKWKDEHSIKVYELAKNGYSNKMIAKAMGVNKKTVQNWLADQPLCKTAIRKGRSLFKNNSASTENFMNYVHKRLPKKIRKTWDRISALQTAPSGLERTQRLLDKKGTEVRQFIFIHALVSSNFRKSVAMKKSCVSYAMLDTWIENDPDFYKLIDFIQQLRGDFFEDHLCSLIADGDTQAIIFANRTFNRGRGYDDKVSMQIDKKVEHTHVIQIDEAGLSLVERKKILDNIRAKRLASDMDVKALPTTERAKYVASQQI